MPRPARQAENHMAPANKPALSSSQEDYLEAVLDLVRAGHVARVRDIARRLGVGMPSVSVALRALRGRGLVNYNPYQVITLTESGRRLGEGVGRRHSVLEDFLTTVLGVEPARARSNACRMEHAIDNVVLNRLRDFARSMRQCPRAGRSPARQPARGAGESRQAGRGPADKIGGASASPCGRCLTARAAAGNAAPAQAGRGTRT
jgi:DtxR family transcriptional regulator, Mn-dependent transcriptional regulator